MGLPLIALLAIAAVTLSGGGDTPPAPEDRPQGGGGEAAGQGARLGTPALGSADAPVVLTEYSDYQ